MKNRIRFAITLAGVVLCALPNVAMAQSSPGDSQGGQAAAIEGTWITKAQPVGGGFGYFYHLTSYSAGGVISGTGAVDRKPPFAPTPTAPVSPTFGSWARVDNNTYVVSNLSFSFDTLGNAVYTLRGNITIRLVDDNTMAGVGSVFTCDLDGTNCKLFGQVTMTGTRLIAQGASN